MNIVTNTLPSPASTPLIPTLCFAFLPLFPFPATILNSVRLLLWNPWILSESVTCVCIAYCVIAAIVRSTLLLFYFSVLPSGKLNLLSSSGRSLMSILISETETGSDANNKHQPEVNYRPQMFSIVMCRRGVDPRHILRWADGMLLFGSTVTTAPFACP